MQIKCTICRRTVEVGIREDPATFQCDFCKQMFKSKNQASGQQKSGMTTGEKITTQCPHCQKQFRMYGAAIGRDIKCLNCGKVFTVQQCESKEQNDASQISPEHKTDSAQIIDEYSGKLERHNKEKALITSSLIWLVLAGLAILALTADVFRRTRLRSPDSGKCIMCGSKPAKINVQYGKDNSFGSYGPYIRKDYYENSEEKRLCYLCNKRMAVRKQGYTYPAGHLYMDVCGRCIPPPATTVKILEGREIEINQWKNYYFCARCADLESMTGDSLSTIPRKFILPVILLFAGLFTGILILAHNLGINSIGEFYRLSINVWKPLELE